MKKRGLKIFSGAAVVLAAGLFLLNLGYTAGGSVSGEYCTLCHEIVPSRDHWAGSSHRNVQCKACHGGLFTANLGFHLNNFHRLLTHVKGELPERIILDGAQADFVAGRCQACHQGNWSRWMAGGHSMRYADVFLNVSQNRRVSLNEDCTRCHGMYDQGAVESIVTPMDTLGPWRLLDPRKAGIHAIPCLACHRVHAAGDTTAAPDYSRPKEISYSRTGKTITPSLAFYDRRERMHFGAEILPLPVVVDSAGRVITISPDRRQGLCYQCHAPQPGFRLASGDDRTPAGVHEGISCLGCHDPHSQDAAASCDNCHPKMSNCGLDVRRMDTTFRDLSSPHNIHRVSCLDCHPAGVPKKL